MMKQPAEEQPCPQVVDAVEQQVRPCGAPQRDGPCWASVCGLDSIPLTKANAGMWNIMMSRYTDVPGCDVRELQ